MVINIKLIRRVTCHVEGEKRSKGGIDIGFYYFVILILNRFQGCYFVFSIYIPEIHHNQ